MDDLILRAAIWQDGHWIDRSALLDCGPQITAGAAKVVLVSFDQNCMFFLPSVIEYADDVFLYSTSQSPNPTPQTKKTWLCL